MRGRKTIFVALLAVLTIVGTAVVAIAHSTASGNRVVGARNKVEAETTGGSVRWILPGPRELDPVIFGTPGAEKGLDLLPLGKRAATADGYFFSMDGTTPAPTPFSDTSKPITGEAEIEVEDVTAVSGPSTRDRIDAEFEFTSPAGDEYRLVVKRALPEIDHENFGGVGVNALQHGATGIGTPLMPQVMSYVAFWGAGRLWVNGVEQPDTRFVHFMLSQRVRTDVAVDGSGYELAFNDEVDADGPWQAHLILPPVAVRNGAPVVNVPVPTGFVLPNGAEQPFMHIMFDSVRVEG